MIGGRESGNGLARLEVMVAFQVVLGHLKNAVQEISEASTTMETAKATRRMMAEQAATSAEGGFGRPFPTFDGNG